MTAPENDARALRGRLGRPLRPGGLERAQHVPVRRPEAVERPEEEHGVGVGQRVEEPDGVACPVGHRERRDALRAVAGGDRDEQGLRRAERHDGRQVARADRVEPAFGLPEHEAIGVLGVGRQEATRFERIRVDAGEVDHRRRQRGDAAAQRGPVGFEQHRVRPRRHDGAKRGEHHLALALEVVEAADLARPAAHDQQRCGRGGATGSSLASRCRATVKLAVSSRNGRVSSASAFSQGKRRAAQPTDSLV